MTDPNKNAKKSCNLEDCQFSRGKQKLEEEEIKTVNLCTDPICTDAHKKKLGDMSHGLSQLEMILKTMTGLCKEPKCPSERPSIITKMEEFQQSPVPTKIEFTNPPPHNDALDYKTCKGTTCYSAYMGYKLEPPEKEKEVKVCDSYSCVPQPKAKPCCTSNICPFSQNVEKPKTDPYPKTTTMGPCGGFTCGAPKKDLFSSGYIAPTNMTFPTTPLSKPCNMQTCPLAQQNQPQSDQAAVGVCGTCCPFSSLETAQEKKPNTPVNYSIGDTGNTSIAPCGNEACPYSKPAAPPQAPCRNETCPYSKPAAPSQAPCGNVSCPYSKPSGPPKVGICGRTSCPFASITPNVKPRTTAPCGNPCCSSGETSYDPVGLCGQAVCPMMPKTSPGAIKPCPFADKIKRYSCGSPSCTYVNPSGMLHTHEYKTDISYVREASRPYCGSASPYDYMSSITPSYPTNYTTNYPLFSYTIPPTVAPCPFMPKKENKTCGKPTCPYGQKIRSEKDNFCIDSTCPFGEGICGGPRKFSCDNPHVEHCESPDCTVQFPKQEKEKCSCCGKSLKDEDDRQASKRKEKKKKRSTCCRIAEEPDEDFCGTSTCPQAKKKPKFCNDPECQAAKREEEDTCENPICPLAAKKKARSVLSHPSSDEDYEGADFNQKFDKCTSKTCPYLKKLVFCDGCGGVLPDETSSSSEVTTTVNDSVEAEVGSITVALEKSISDVTVKKTKLPSKTKVVEPVESVPVVEKKEKDKVPKEVEPVDSPTKVTKVAEEVVEQPVPKKVSLYSYPGVQIGHKYCYYWRYKRIPKNMGWRWGGFPCMERHPKLWIGYKPGSILKSVYKKIKVHHKLMGISEPTEKKKKPKTRMMLLKDLKHCIEVKKKEGEFMITMNPVKDPTTRDPMDNPYMDCTPIQFKVEKEKKEVHQVYCPCDESDIAPSVDSSEFEFHFTPPSAIPETIFKKQKNLVSVEVQYNCKDLAEEYRKGCKSNGGGGKKGGKGGKGGKKGKKK